MGVPRGALRTMRKNELREGDDFERQAGAVILLESGQKKVQEALGVPAGVSCAPERPPIRVTLTVDAPARGNPKIVHCRTEKGLRVRLRVRDNMNFTPGLAVPNCVQEHADLFCFEGRLPRWRGKF